MKKFAQFLALCSLNIFKIIFWIIVSIPFYIFIGAPIGALFSDGLGLGIIGTAIGVLVAIAIILFNSSGGEGFKRNYHD